MTKSFYGNKVLALSFLVAMLMVSVEVSPLTGAFCAVLMFWKWGVERWQWRALSRRWTSVLSVVALVQVLVQFRTLIGQEPAYTFLIALSALRVMDYKNERDHRFLVLLGFLLISIKALFSLDIYWIIPSVLAFGGLWYSLLPEVYPQRMRLVLRMFILSMPFAMFMFFAFPRFMLPWAMSRGSSPHGEIGFSDDINPGGVAEIASTNAMAFRARLTNIPLAVTADMYWRGSVLSVSKGLAWSAGKPLGMTSTMNLEGLPTYDVAIEATSQRYIFALEGTRSIRSDFVNIIPLENDVFRSTRLLTKAMVYVGYWDHEHVNTDTPGEQERQIPQLSGQVKQWVDKINAKNTSVRDRLGEIKKLFSETGFVYTIAPGAYAENGLEEFLFNRKRGFCEHYAGAYATLARALGVPSRVVIGYQGGKFNPWGDFWRVSQKDAHAWVEVFTDGKWMRIDPTTWVAPLRLTIGAEEFFNLSEEEQRTFARSASWRPNWKDSTVVWDQITMWAEDLNYQWTYFLMDFDRGSQRNFWENILEQKAPIILFIIAVGLFIYVSVRSRLPFSRRLSLRQQLLWEVERWGQSRKRSREIDTPPLSYLRGLEKDFPQLKDVLKKIGQVYDRTAYAGKELNKRDLKKLKTEWKKEIKNIS